MHDKLEIPQMIGGICWALPTKCSVDEDQLPRTECRVVACENFAKDGETQGSGQDDAG